MKKKKVLLINEEATLDLGKKLACCVHPPLVMYLKGTVGVGKTTFSRALLRSLGYNGTVRSPTYTLVETYHLKEFTVYHFDFYRISSYEELKNIGIFDYFTSKSVCLIEWPEKGKGMINLPDLSLCLSYKGEWREGILCSFTSHGDHVLKFLLKKGIKILDE